MCIRDRTKLIHGEAEAVKAQEGARALFGAGTDTDNMPSTQLTKEQFAEDGIDILDLLLATGLIPSKGKGRRLIQQGGISIDDKKVTSPYERISLDAFEKGYVIIKKGKKVYHKASFEQ